MGEAEEIKQCGDSVFVNFKTFCTPEYFDIEVDGVIYGSKEWRDKYIGKYWYQRFWRQARLKKDAAEYYFHNLWKAIKADYSEYD